MNNPEDIFSHLPPADRPEPVKASSLSNYDERERSMIQSALRVMLLMPVKDKTGVRTHYTDFDRASYIVAEAKKRGDSATHEDAIEALNRAGEPIVEQRQAEVGFAAATGGDAAHNIGAVFDHVGNCRQGAHRWPICFS